MGRIRRQFEKIVLWITTRKDIPVFNFKENTMNMLRKKVRNFVFSFILITATLTGATHLVLSIIHKNLFYFVTALLCFVAVYGLFLYLITITAEIEDKAYKDLM